MLWSGRLVGVVDTHSDQPLARGFLPFRPAPGTCEIRGNAANLWYATAKALGIVVTTLRYPDTLFVGHLTGFCTGAKSLNPSPGCFRRPCQLPTVVFSDLAGLPLCPKYWDAWMTTHAFYCLPTVPSGGGHKVTGQGGKVGLQLVEDKRPRARPRPRKRLGGPPPGGSHPGQHV